LEPARYRINSPHVIAETLEGETTIVDLNSGTYHALNETGSLVWDEINSGAEAPAAAGSLSQTFDADPAEAERDVTALVAELLEQGLIVPDEGGRDGEAPERASANGNGNGSRGVYAAPKLSTYTDMQELLLLDPIHEVDESGWPSTL
jgi:coenzyme PQQ synthesis protein D (PqqD)